MSTRDRVPRTCRRLGTALAILMVVVGAVLLPAQASASARVDDAPHATALVSAGSWTWPIDAPHPIERPFVAPATVYSAGHRGIDIGPATGSVVHAPADGVVHFAGVVVDRPVLSIEHDGGVLSSYEPISTGLTAGAVVHRGDPIGVVAAGHCADICLHFGVRVNGEYVSPLLFLGGVPRAILWPASGSP